MGGLLFFATLNACSYFSATDYAWRRLTADTQGVLLDDSRLRLGFPLTISFYVGSGIVEARQWAALVGNFTCGLIVSAAVALCYGSSLPTTDKASSEPQTEKESTSPWQLRFRLYHLFVMTTVVAVLLGIFADAPNPAARALKLLYLAGPCLIVWGYYLLRRHPVWQTCVLSTAALAMAVAAAYFGSSVANDFTLGLFGLFVCWLPQLLVMAFVAILTQSLQFSPED